jgi:hypothetical protein
MNAESEDGILMEGYLEFKRLHLTFMWKTRRFVLGANGTLSRFKGQGFIELCETFEINHDTVLTRVHGSDLEFTVAFEHPTHHKHYVHHVRCKSASDCDAWFNKISAFQQTMIAGGRLVDKKELQLHHSRHDCWIAINGTVYDVSKFLTEHPGGPEFLMQQAGRDGSDPYNSAGTCIIKARFVYFVHARSCQVIPATPLATRSRAVGYPKLASLQFQVAVARRLA